MLFSKKQPEYVYGKDVGGYNDEDNDYDEDEIENRDDDD